MGGRGAGTGRTGGAGSGSNMGAGITNRDELIRLYNSISGNSNLSVDQRVKAMEDIRKRINQLGNS